MPYMRLQPTHPMFKKVEQLFALMTELKIGMSVIRHEVYFTDETKKFPDVRITDNENIDEPVTEFPPTWEFKLVYPKED